jgi:alkyl sulfatase BDS1-like metallo-beta-lactamase superfamily hydrolase
MQKDQLIMTTPLMNIFSNLVVRLDPIASINVNTCAGFRFPDIDEAYTVWVRHGVAELHKEHPSVRGKAPDIDVVMSSTTWREIVSNHRSPVAAYALGDVVIDATSGNGGVALAAFLLNFDTKV